MKHRQTQKQYSNSNEKTLEQIGPTVTPVGSSGELLYAHPTFEYAWQRQMDRFLNKSQRER